MANITLLVYGLTTRALLQGLPNIRPALDLAVEDVQRSSAGRIEISLEYVMNSEISSCESYAANYDQLFSYFYRRSGGRSTVALLSAGWFLAASDGTDFILSHVGCDDSTEIATFGTGKILGVKRFKIQLTT